MKHIFVTLNLECYFENINLVWCYASLFLKDYYTINYLKSSFEPNNTFKSNQKSKKNSITHLDKKKKSI